MKRTLLTLIALTPLLGCASSQYGYGGGGGGAAYLYGDCFYLEDCYDGYYRDNYYAAYPNGPTLILRQSVEQVRNRHATRVIGDRWDGGSNSGWASGPSSEGTSSRSSVVTSDGSSRGTISVAPRGDSSPPPSSGGSAPVSHAATKQ